ncbi:MAG: glucose-6-phosphate isomerase [Enhydrobacter sp.]|nr:MAG: glucose-6-phosphate isomerase [Enhydrobacter sp.]
MHYRHSIDDALEESIGRHGLSRASLERAMSELGPALDKLRHWHDSNELPLLRLPARRDDLAALKPHADRFAEFEHVVVMGMGGSSLSGKTLVALKDRGFGPAPGRPKLWFMDNVDPATYAELLSRLPLDRTGFIPISKSGGTPETLAQLFAILGALEARVGKAAIGRHMIAITEATDNPLRRLAERLGATVLEHDPKVGGRFSALSLVGMLPAMIAGVDAAAVREGAASVLDPVLAANDVAGIAPASGAALNVGLAREKGINISVLMPYVDRLNTFASWYRQIWAESLGKDGLGTTPAVALGTVDQHSQVQLYLGGPADKLFTFLIQDTAGQGHRMSVGGDKALEYLAGNTMGDLLLAEADATAGTTVAAGRPTRTIRVREVDERTMGALMMHFMLETIFAAHLWKIDAFDQPRVEDAKVLTRQYLSQRRKP